MKILLINPPRFNEIIGNNPLIIEEERGFNPPLGLLYVASYIETYSKHIVKVLDSQVEKLTYAELQKRIKQEEPDIVGMTAMTMTLIDVLKTASIVKKLSSDTKVVLGGPHVHLFPDETISFNCVDFLVLGEGEESFCDLVNAIENKRELGLITGIVYKNKDRVIKTGLRSYIADLDKIPFPARHLTPYHLYTSLLSKNNVVTTLFTSRGCPFRCSFCDRPNLGKVFRARSASNVIAEIESCLQLGICDFMFYDDTFTVNRQRVIDICNEIIKAGLKISWDIRTRIDTVDEEMLKLLKKAGCEGIHYGIEAGTEKILKILNKGITIDKARNIFALTKKQGIPILAYFMIGNPSETRNDIEETFKIMKELDPDYVHITIFTPFPGTEIYMSGLKEGKIRQDVWREFAKNPSSTFCPPYWDENFSRKDLQLLLSKGYKMFYLRPSYIMKRISKLRSPNELKKRIKAGIKVLIMK